MISNSENDRDEKGTSTEARIGADQQFGEMGRELPESPLPPEFDSMRSGDSDSGESEKSNGPNDVTPDRNMGLIREIIQIIAPLLVIGIGIGGLLLLKSMKAEPVLQDPPDPTPLVRTMVVELNPGGLDIVADGVVVPYREVQMSAQISGRIRFKDPICRTGNYVTAGTLLMEIDTKDYDLELQRLEKELAQSENSIRELAIGIENAERLQKLANDELDLQRKELERVEKLFAKEFVSETEIDHTRRATLVAESAVMKLANDIVLQKATGIRIESARDRVLVQQERAKVDLSRTKIVSPVDGVITVDPVEQDWYVSMGTSLVTIEDTSRVEVRCNLQPDELYWLWMDQKQAEGDQPVSILDSPLIDYSIPKTPVTITYEIGEHQYNWDGVLARYDGVGIDEKTRTMPCRIVVNDPRQMQLVANGQTLQKRSVGPPALVRGMYVTVSIHSDPNACLFRIPEQALQPNGDLLVVRDGKLDIVESEVIDVRDGNAIVRTADGRLNPGDRVIVSPLAYVVNGMTVREQEVSP